MTVPDDTHLASVAAISAERRRGFNAVRDGLTARSFTATSDDRRVVVAVDGTGRVLDIEFAADTFRAIPPSELGGRVLQALWAARERANDEARRGLVDVLGHSPLIPEKCEQPARRRRPLDDGASFEDDTYLRSWR